MTIENKMMLEKHQTDLHELQKHRNSHKYLMALAGIVTLITYLAFAGHLHLGNPLYWSSYFDKGTSAIFGFFFYLIIVVLTGIFLAWVKHFTYLHFARFGSIMSITVTLVLFALLAEFFSATANQDAKSEIHLEHNSAYQNTLKPASAPVTADAGLAKQIGDAEFKLAGCKRLLAEGKVTDCNNSKARVDSLAAQQKQVLETQITVSTETTKINNDRQDKLKADSYNASIVMLAQFYAAIGGGNYDYYIKAANLTMMLIIAVVFEVLHVFLITAKRQMDEQIDSLTVKIGRGRDQAGSSSYSAYNIPTRSKHDTGNEPLFKYQAQPATAPVSSLTELKSEFGKLIHKAPENIATALADAEASQRQTNRTIAAKIDNLTGKADQPNRPDRVNAANLTDLTAEADRKSANLTDLTAEADRKSANLTDLTAQPDRAESDLADRVRPGELRRPTLDYKTAVSMISANVRGMLDSGKCRPEIAMVTVACKLTYDQLEQVYPLPELDLPLIAKSILANLTANLPEPDLAEITPPTEPEKLTGQVGQVSFADGQVSPEADRNLTERVRELEQKLTEEREKAEADRKQAEADRIAAEAKAEADRKQAEADRKQAEADRKQAEADRAAAQRLADAKAAEAKARAEAEAAAKLKAEREAREAAEKRAAAKAEADRKQAEADRIAAEEAAERGKLTDQQIDDTMAAIAAAIRAKQIDKLGFPTIKDIARAASGIGSNDILRNLCNISCRRLVATGLTAPNPDAGNGKPNFIIA